jgi:hypothetical protein
MDSQSDVYVPSGQRPYSIDDLIIDPSWRRKLVEDTLAAHPGGVTRNRTPLLRC